MSERKLVTIEKVLETRPIEGSDFIEQIKIRGWNLVSKKGEFNVGDKCVFFEVDSLIPEGKECFEFLRKSCWNERLKGFRIKTVKLRGVISQGLALPISYFPEFKNLQIGVDVTEKLNVTVYEPYIDLNINANAKGAFPSFLKDTSLDRIQNLANPFEEYKGKEIIITEKIDGTSHTFYINNGEVGMCSKNLDLKIESDKKDVRNELFITLDIENKLRKLNMNIAIQGEIIGKSIQRKNYTKFTDNKNYDFYVYRIYDIDTRTFYTIEESKRIAEILDLNFVRIIEKREMFKSLEEAIEYSNGKSNFYDGTMEGIVVTVEDKNETLYDLTQFKVLSPNYLLKEK